MNIRLPLLFLIAASFVSPAFRRTVTLTWNYDFTGTTLCGPTGKSCLRHFEVGTLNGTAFNTIRSVALSPGSKGPVTGITASFPLAQTAGHSTVAVIMVAHDPQGHRITSDPTLCSAPIH